MTSWMQYRIRTKWLEGNLLLILLRLLREGPLAQWEILDSLYRSFGLSPDERIFGELVQSLGSQGYLSIRGEGKRHQLQISRDGLKLLSELEKEYKAIVSGT